MSLRSLFHHWNEFFFKPQSPTPIALYRILFGLLVIADLVLLRPSWLTWYGPKGFLTLDTVYKVSMPGPRINFFAILPQTDFAVNAFFWAFLLVAISLTLGFMTRFSAVAVCMCLGSIQERNFYILNSGDSFLRIMSFILIFAPAGAALSVDRLLRIRRGRVGAAIPLYSPWAQRLIQIQLAVLYFATFYWKTLGPSWMDGTAVYYVLRLDAFRHFPMPSINALWLVKCLTWGTLLIEFSLGVLVWFKELRYPVLIAGLCLHLGIEYSMNIPLFEWIMIATFVTFVEPEDLSRMWKWIRGRFGQRLVQPRILVLASNVREIRLPTETAD